MEVFIHDPLFKWALSPVKALQLQRDDYDANSQLHEMGKNTTTLQPQYRSAAPKSASIILNSSDLCECVCFLQTGENNNNEVNSSGSKGGNTDAERALLRLKAKLQGYEHGQALSVEGQVKQLIAEAQDPNRLAEMFPGWAPWL